jgi:hypothetical protein
MADTQESYPTPTTGLNLPLFMKLSGTNVVNANPETASGTLVGGNNTYKVSLSLANSVKAGASATVVVTVNLFDLAGTAQGIKGSVTAVSYNANPTSAGSGTQESYPAPLTTYGEIATVGTVSYSASAGTATITPVQVGQAVVEFEYPFALNANNTAATEPSPNPGGALGFQQNDMVYSQILVQVLP